MFFYKKKKTISSICSTACSWMIIFREINFYRVHQLKTPMHVNGLRVKCYLNYNIRRRLRFKIKLFLPPTELELFTTQFHNLVCTRRRALFRLLATKCPPLWKVVKIEPLRPGAIYMYFIDKIFNPSEKKKNNKIKLRIRWKYNTMRNTPGSRCRRKLSDIIKPHERKKKKNYLN